MSWTNHHADGAYYSGDITDAADGATEFIDVPLADVTATHVVPQVNIYAGEGFDQAAESMSGFMTREHHQQGMPFEPATVRSRSAMRGTGRVALPVVFSRGADGAWTATWLHLYPRGIRWANRTEANRTGTATLVRAIVRRRHLTVAYLVELMREYTPYTPDLAPAEPVTFIGIERPDGLPEGSEVITLDRLNQLVPD
ncbi:hypothetical protein [Pseudonocardia acaciae]|uniref:hypothetical protein n=1 Tax=Pseudonocardia acaciae TaxID=551276 RepID=UPI00048B78EF|nr:hypothetical protein [Pseudonocardia acaciae]